MTVPLMKWLLSPKQDDRVAAEELAVLAGAYSINMRFARGGSRIAGGKSHLLIVAVNAVTYIVATRRHAATDRTRPGEQGLAGWHGLIGKLTALAGM